MINTAAEGYTDVKNQYIAEIKEQLKTDPETTIREFFEAPIEEPNEDVQRYRRLPQQIFNDRQKVRNWLRNSNAIHHMETGARIRGSKAWAFMIAANNHPTARNQNPSLSRFSLEPQRS